MEPFISAECASRVPLECANIDTDQIIPARFIWRKRAPTAGGSCCSTTCASTRTARRGPISCSTSAGYAGARIVVGGPQFRLRLVARERRVGAAETRHPRVHRAELRRHLLQQLLPERPAARSCCRRPACAALRALLEQYARRAHRGRPRKPRPSPGRMGVNDGGRSDHFDIDPFRKQLLLSGMDDISFTLNHRDSIVAFEARFAKELPWI